MVGLFIDYQRESDCIQMLGKIKNKYVITFPFLHASNTLPSKFVDSVDLKDGLLINRVCTVQ